MGTLGRIPAASLDGRTESRREITASTDLSVRVKGHQHYYRHCSHPVVPDHQMPQCDLHAVPAPPLTFGLLDALLCDITLSLQDEVAMTLLSTKACYLLGLSPPAKDPFPKDPFPNLPSGDGQYQQSPRPRRTQKNVPLAYSGHQEPSPKPITTSFHPPTWETPNFLPSSFRLSECQPLDIFFMTVKTSSGLFIAQYYRLSSEISEQKSPAQNTSTQFSLYSPHLWRCVEVHALQAGTRHQASSGVNTL